MSSLGITTFLRVDDHMLDIVLPYVSFSYPYKRHHAIWVIPTSADSNELVEWFSNQDKESYSGIINLPKINDAVINKGNEPEYIGLGVSYSQLNLNQIKRIAKKGTLGFVKLTPNVSKNNIPTDNPLIQISNSNNIYYYSDETRSNYTPLEQEFVESLKGHDFYYNYSDSLEVYRRGKRQEAELKEAGVKLGLSIARVNELYNATFNDRTWG